MKAFARLLGLIAIATLGAPAAFAGGARQELPGLGPQPASHFYTGKPYDADLGAYVFAARTYDPQINRWTTSDPSGFPDGANNRVYAPVPSSEVDPSGHRRRARDSNFWRGWNLDAFDERGSELFGHWLDGSGDAITTMDGRWGRYLKGNDLLTQQIDGWLQQDFSSRTDSGAISLTKHAEIENGYTTGYEMLHGSNATVGDFTITGNASGNTCKWTESGEIHSDE